MVHRTECNAGEVIKPDSWVCIEDEGMPVKGAPYNRGNLYIHYEVVFPDSLSRGDISKLKNLLPAPEKKDVPMDGKLDCDLFKSAWQNTL